MGPGGTAAGDTSVARFLCGLSGRMVTVQVVRRPGDTSVARFLYGLSGRMVTVQVVRRTGDTSVNTALVIGIRR
jgi:hypothetical protein